MTDSDPNGPKDSEVGRKQPSRSSTPVAARNSRATAQFLPRTSANPARAFSDASAQQPGSGVAVLTGGRFGELVQLRKVDHDRVGLRTGDNPDSRVLASAGDDPNGMSYWSG